jgi:tetratricopeptide (TPR) repeat protein
MMSSLITKTNKSRSPASHTPRTTKGKKAADKKPQRPGKITAAPKAKKAAPAKGKKPAPAKKSVAAAPKKAAAAASKKTPPSKVVKAVAKPTKKPVVKTPPRQAVAKRVAASVTPAKAVQPQPKKTPPATLLAVKAFEQALRLFNRHDYTGAKEAFEDILTRFGEQADIVAPARTYMAICDQRMARVPAVPRNPDALYDQGVVQLNKGNFSEAVGLFEKALKVEPRADHVWYSLSAAYARMHQPSKSLDALRRAIGMRSVHRSHARRDPDFASLHTSEEFQQLTGFGFDFDEE